LVKILIGPEKGYPRADQKIRGNMTTEVKPSLTPIKQKAILVPILSR
jgi:hypothetical protein